MYFNMSITDNHASFIDKDSGLAVFVDSFDNREFEVRTGTIDQSSPAGCITAATSQEPNAKLAELLLSIQALSNS